MTRSGHGRELGAGSAGVRAAQSARRREQLLEAALALFSEEGFRGTSVRDITRRAGVTEAVLYHYFANKADLWATVLATYAPFSRVAVILDEVESAPIDAALAMLGVELLGLMRERRQLVLTLLSEAPEAPEVAAALGQFLQGVAGDLARFLAQRQKAGEIAAGVDLTAVARAFQGALLARFLTTSLMLQPEADRHDREEVARLVVALMRGLAPRDVG